MPKLNPVRVPIRSRNPMERVKDFDEIVLGYTDAEVKAEADRCLLCPKPPCVAGCPAHNPIPQLMKLVREGNLPEASKVWRQTTNLPGVCGRVCDKAKQCEGSCVVGKRGDPLAIGHVERYLADWEIDHGMGGGGDAVTASATGKRVAVVGSGPAGLGAAAVLIRLGHGVTVFEAEQALGGVLTWGIPAFRLPRQVMAAELSHLQMLGVEFKTGVTVGKAVTVDELLTQSYDAVFIGAGAVLPVMLECAGEGLKGVYSANDFLTTVNLAAAKGGKAQDIPLQVGDRIAVIGGGNTAMDAAQVGMRLGAKEVWVVYRRSEVEMPARREEAESARAEGVQFRWLTNPVCFLDKGTERLQAMECIAMELGEPDASGRRRPIPKAGSEFQLPVDTAVVAVSTKPSPEISQTTPGLEVTRWDTIVADEATGKTKREGVWAGGDVVTGPDRVVTAMYAGRQAAKAIHQYLTSQP